MIIQSQEGGGLGQNGRGTGSEKQPDSGLCLVTSLGRLEAALTRVLQRRERNQGWPLQPSLETRQAPGAKKAPLLWTQCHHAQVKGAFFSYTISNVDLKVAIYYCTIVHTYYENKKMTIHTISVHG